jgi:hypothetical protein
LSLASDDLHKNMLNWVFEELMACYNGTWRKRENVLRLTNGNSGCHEGVKSCKTGKQRNKFLMICE